MAKPLSSCIPKQLKIGGKLVKIELITRKQMEEEGIWGCYFPLENKILLCAESDPDQVLDTLLHEVLHAIFSCWNIKPEDDEERTVHTLASALQAIYTDNDHFLKCIQRYAKAARSS